MKIAVEDRIQQAESYYKLSLPRPSFDATLRGRSAGQLVAEKRIYQTSYKIRFNLTLAQANLTAMLADVVPHEIAHLVIMHTYGISKRNRARPHGPEWQTVMQNCFKRPPDIYHQFELPQSQGRARRPLQKFTYTCDCREHELSQIRHKRAIAGTKYLCCKCKQPLKVYGKQLQS